MWAWLWAGWIGYFLVVEGIALVNTRHGDTLSEQMWRYVTQPDRRRGARKPAWWVWPGRAGVVGLGAWLMWHFLTGL
ncbi:hypothetical protein FHR84_003152 [Actinopolyspora biskrensis]|uniref:Uncharacterized protein n=1 Tax=Actinopolyspora biskrensis TaxID=1470178 RepID=A0A852YXI4_9ACTN|nr:hypothetical protein [Actinopolyspora biskrensis]NYH79814.1 hypothetical protein [Actinopolyspora biskrensis]